MQSIDKINDFRGAVPDSQWPAWKRGEMKRKEIIDFMKRNPRASMKEVAAGCGISLQQLHRHRQFLSIEGRWPSMIAAWLLLLLSPYYALDYLEDCHVKFRVLSVERSHDYQ